MTERLPPGSPCTNCGKCCTNTSYMGSLTTSGEDVIRWRREGRTDILAFAAVMGPPDDPYADLWVDQNGNERLRCPFVRKVPNQNRYLCRIYESRPQIFRDYTPWASGTICEIVR
jgi:Fe-S-cluster containining protein